MGNPIVYSRTNQPGCAMAVPIIGNLAYRAGGIMAYQFIISLAYQARVSKLYPSVSLHRLNST